jgi:hypothetical protein
VVCDAVSQRRGFAGSSEPGRGGVVGARGRISTGDADRRDCLPIESRSCSELDE